MEDTPPANEPAVHVMESGPAELTHYLVGEKRMPAWTVRWKSAQLEFTDRGDKGGEMQQVTGEIYQDGKEASDYSADTAKADRETGILAISGHVRVHAHETQYKTKDGKTQTFSAGDLTCNKMSWDPSKKILIATGHVKIDQNGYTVDNVPELWCSPDLMNVSTPGLFKEHE